MPGPTPWQQTPFVVNATSQTIITNAETVVATLGGIFSRTPGAAIYVTGYAAFTVNAATTSTVARIRIGSVTGAVVGVSAPVTNTAGTTQANLIDLSVQDVPAGEYFNQTYVMTVQSTAAAANWTVTLASLSALL